MNLNKLTDIENVTLDLSAEHKGEKAKEVFCENWDNSKKGLELVIVMVKNPIVKLIVNIVIAVGDGIQSKICVEKK